MFLLTLATRFLVRSTPVRTWSEAQPIFKDYYSRRLTLSPGELEQFLLRLSGKQFSESDHRWVSLLQNIENKLPKFHLHSRVYMLKVLAGMGSRAELTEKLLQNIMDEVKLLTFEESALLLWCLSRCAGPNRVHDASKIYERLCEILLEHADEDGVRIVISRQEYAEFERKTLALKSSSICMVLSAMAKLGITEKTVVKHLLRDGVRPNLAAFSANGLVSLLIALEKLGMRNKRDSLSIYLETRKRAQQFETGPIETIQNLAFTVSNLAQSKHFDEAEADGRPKPTETVEKLREIKKGIGKFVLWLCETIQLRQKALSKQKSAKILHYCGKVHAFHADIWSKSLANLCSNIEDCKIIDLVMALKALTRLSEEERRLFTKQEEQISKRLWVLHSSISGKSLSVLAELLQDRKITPPPRVAELLASHSTKRSAEAERAHAGKGKGEGEKGQDQR